MIIGFLEAKKSTKLDGRISLRPASQSELGCGGISAWLLKARAELAQLKLD